MKILKSNGFYKSIQLYARFMANETQLLLLASTACPIRIKGHVFTIKYELGFGTSKFSVSVSVSVWVSNKFYPGKKY